MLREPTADVPARNETSRRKLLALGAAVVGGLAATGLRPSAAEAHGTVHADSATEDPAIHGNNTSSGAGVQGDSASGIGVSGRSNGADVPGPAVAGVQGTSNVDGVLGLGGRYGLHGFSFSGEGVHGVTISGKAVVGIGVNGTGVEGNANFIGVKGLSGPGVGINGESFAGDGVVGLSHHMDHYGVVGTNDTPDPDPTAPPFPQGAGVFGQGVNIGVKAFSNDGHAVDARSTNGTALDAGSLTGIGLGIHSGGTAIRVTGGKLKFNSVGAGTIPAGASTHVVPHGHVTINSHITVVLTSDPGNAAMIQWVTRATGSFTINLTRSPRNDTTFTYFVVDPSFP